MGRARCWEFGHDATFRQLKDTPAFINTSVPKRYNARPSQKTKPTPNTRHPQPTAKPTPNVADAPQKTRSVPKVVSSPPETTTLSPAVIEAAQAAVERAEVLLQGLPPDNALRLRYSISTYVSSVNQALDEQAYPETEVQTQALQTLLDSLEALLTGDIQRSTKGLSHLIIAENNPQLRAELGQLLRQIGRDVT